MTKTLLDQLHKLAACVPDGNRGKPIAKLLDQVRGSIDRQSFEKHSRELLKRKLDEVENTLYERNGENRN